MAEKEGVGGISLRGLARGLGMTAPSLYSYFPSKHALYDALFAQGYAELQTFADEQRLDRGQPEQTLARALRGFVRFCQASPARYELMFQRPVPGYEPSPEAYAVSQAAYAQMASALERIGITAPADLDLYTAVSAGLAAQQMANDPDGDRWLRRCRDAAAMFYAHVGAKQETETRP